MDKDYMRYTLDKIESAVNDYTTMDREDVAEYVLRCLECLMEDCDGYKRFVKKIE